MNDLDQVLKAADPMPQAPTAGAGARELRAHILATAEPRRPVTSRLRWKVWAVAVPVIAAAMVFGVSVLPPSSPLVGPRSAGAALTFTRSGADYIVTVHDLNADPEKYTREFKERGFDIKIRFAPTPPDVVGQLLGGEIRHRGGPGVQLLGSECGEEPGSCTVSIKIPANYRGAETLVLGRPAQPGEPYGGPGQ